MFYLKYRPQKIADLDNNRIKESLGKSLLNSEFAHAYLLIGTRGSGKTTTARLIAKIVNCTGRKKGEEPCNKCDSCLGITEGSSLDVIEVDAASNTGVDDIRELREKVKLSPSSSKFKVYIIDEVHMLSTSAFNALLKTLEEPPKHVIFVLATTDPQKLPQTIISRCLVYDFGKATNEEVLKSIEKKAKKEKLELSDDELSEIVKLANGSFRDADKLLEQVSKGEKLADTNKSQTVATQILDLVEKRNGKEAVLLVERFVEDGGRVKELISALLVILREKMLSGSKESISLTEKIVESYGLIKDSPIEELPLEMVILEFCLEETGQVEEKRLEKVEKASPPPERIENVAESTVSKEEPVSSSVSAPGDIASKWPDIITAVKPYNHNLSALLRSSKPIGFENGFLVIDVFYKFHKDKLSEHRNQEVLEKAISGILGKDIKIKFTLREV